MLRAVLRDLWAAALIEVVREAVGNAIRHGDATALTCQWSSESSSGGTRITAVLTWSATAVCPESRWVWRPRGRCGMLGP